MKYLLYILLASSSCHVTVHAQVKPDFRSPLPQALELNPAQTIEPKGYLTLFPLGGSSLDFSNSGFSFNDVFTYKNGLQVFDANSLLDAVENENLYRSDLRTPLIQFGFNVSKSNKLYINAGLQDVVNIRSTYSDDLFKFLLEGNGAHLGDTLNIGEITLSASHYADAALGFTWIEKKWSLGFRAHFLYGLNHAETDALELNLFTDPDNYAIDGNVHIKVNTSNASTSFIESLNGGINQYLFKQKNRGLAGDAGFMFRPSDHFQFGAALKNIGYITWKSGIENYEVGPAVIHFNGLSVSDFLLNPEEGLSAGEVFLDSLKSEFAVKKNETPFSSRLVPNGNCSFIYSPASVISFALLAQGEQYNSRLNTMFTLSANVRPVHWLMISPSCSYDWNKKVAVGAGLMLRLGCVQFHAKTSDVVAWTNPQSLRSAQVSAGINILFGTHR